MHLNGSWLPPETVFADYVHTIINMMVDHSPFPRGQSDAFGRSAKVKAARIHLDETIFFGQVAYHDLKPKKTIEVCAGLGIPSITLNKLYGVAGICVDTDPEKIAIGMTICKKMNVDLTWEQMDIFAYLRKNAKHLKGTTLLVTAAYCRDKKKGRPIGSGERDLVKFAKNNRMNLGLLPFRSGDIITKGVSSEKKRTGDYEKILEEAGYAIKKHSTKVLFQGQNPPDWFFLDIVTARCS